MRSRLTKAERKSLESIQDRLSTIYYKIENNDVLLHYGNGSVAAQVSCAIAALDCIFQENI